MRAASASASHEASGTLKQLSLNYFIWLAQLFHVARSIVSYGSLNCFMWLAQLFHVARSIVSYRSLNCFIWLAQLFHVAHSTSRGCGGHTAPPTRSLTLSPPCCHNRRQTSQPLVPSAECRQQAICSASGGASAYPSHTLGHTHCGAEQALEQKLRVFDWSGEAQKIAADSVRRFAINLQSICHQSAINLQSICNQSAINMRGDRRVLGAPACAMMTQC